MADKNVLGPFWDLASSDKDKQLRSAKELIVLLQNCQDEYQEKSGDGLCENLSYAVERLVRGLSSNREGARQGFAVCLTEVISLFNCVSIEYVLRLIDKHLTTTGSAKAQEERGAHFGQVCALLAIVQSGRVPSASSDTVCTLLKRFHVLANKKMYLREISTAGLMQLVKVAKSCLNFDEHILPLCEASINGGWEQCSPETLHFMLTLQETYGKDQSLRELLKTKWNHKRLLHVENYSHIAAVLKNSTHNHPRIHSVWPVILDAVRKKGELAVFWKAVVDESLVLSSHERKYLTFKLIESLLPSLSSPEVAAVFTPNVLRCLKNNLTEETNHLHKAAKHLVKSIQTTISHCTDKSLCIGLLLQFQSQSFGKDFNAITKSNLIGTIIEQLDGEAVKSYVEQLWNLFLCPNVDSDVDQYRRNLIDQIMSVFHNHKLKQLNPEQWMVYLTKMAFQQAFFTFNKIPKKSALQCLQLQMAAPPISSDLQQILQHRFVSMLVELSTLQPMIEKVNGVKSKGAPGTDHEGAYLVKQLVDYADSLLNVTNNYVAISTQWLPEMNSIWSQLMEILRDTAERDATRASVQLLMCHTGLQLFYDPKHSVALLQDLLDIYNKMVDNDAVEEGEPHWSEVLTDLLIGLLAQPSQLWRTLSKQVYRHMSSHLTNDAIQLIVKVLDPQHIEELHNYLQMVDEEIKTDDDDDDEEEEEEESVNSSSNDVSDSSSDDDNETKSDMEFKVDEEFRKEIKMALGDAALPSSEDEEDGEDDLDDETMLKIDDALAKAFQARKQSSSTNRNRKDFQLQLMEFRLRVLDLVEVYIRWQSRSISSLDLIMPLFRLTMSCSNESLPLANRAAGIYTKKLCHMKEYPRIVENERDRVFSILQQLLQAAYKVPTAGQEMVTQGSMFLLRVLRGGREESNALSAAKRKRKRDVNVDANFGLIDVPAVISLFNDLLTDFITNKNSHVHQMLFAALMERYPDLGWHLSTSLCSQLPNAVNHFRRAQACEVMTSLLHQPVQLPEARKTFLLSISKDLKCFCMDYLKSGDHEKKSKHIKPVVKLLHQLIVVSCKEQPEIFAVCFGREELLTEINELAESNNNSPVMATECRKLIASINKVDDRLEHKTKKRKR